MQKHYFLPAGGLAVINPCGTFEEEPSYIDTGIWYMERLMRARITQLKREIEDLDREINTAHEPFVINPGDWFLKLITVREA